MILLAVALFLVWLLADLRLARGWRVLLGICAVLAAAGAGYSSGRLVVSLEYSWVPKHNALMEASIQSARERLSSGDTNSVLRGLDAYRNAVSASERESRVLPAASAMLSEVERRGGE